MLDINDFSKKQILVYSPMKGDKLSYRNDNMIISNSDGEIKYQTTCYRIFMVLVIGDCTITTGLLRRAKKFGFSICFSSYQLRLYATVNAAMEGNILLHEKQFSYEGNGIAKLLVYNKIINQCALLGKIRNKSPYVKEGIDMLRKYSDDILKLQEPELGEILGIEGNASRIYFARVFDILDWKGRKPRIKFDYINSLLDIGYSILFNFVDCILQVFGFDVYQGVLHTRFYMRKSLVCDLMEPFRPIIDWRVRKGIGLKQFKKDDFIVVGNQWQLEYKYSSKYAGIFLEDLLANREAIFLYLRSYYRSFMKGKAVSFFPVFDITAEHIKMIEDDGALVNYDYREL